MINRFFLEHPRSVGESYTEHLRAAGRFGGTMIISGLACLIHGLVPRLFTRTGSTAVSHLHEHMVTKRRAGGSAVGHED
ncbi:MAG: hypothetical protein JWR80_3136 [Bradyrhizobium sp.]|nr:hypothetical protein [Bradyrhizobium sp.]